MRKLRKYTPTKFMAKGSYYDKNAADYAVSFIEQLRHTKGEFYLKGQAVYTSTEKALSESVSELLWSLGIKNAISTSISTQRVDWNMPSQQCGGVATGETIYAVKYTAFDDMPIAGLERKLKNRVQRNPTTRSHYRYIDKIEAIENHGMQCIQVDSPSHQRQYAAPETSRCGLRTKQ